MLREGRSMNFSRVAVDSATAYVGAVKRFLDHRRKQEFIRRGQEETHVRNRAILWGGLSAEELNALARLAGHPFAPDLPEWMEGGTT